jgi:3-methyladenine DNA glycosylase Tag
MTITPFATILKAAQSRHGAALEGRLPQPTTPAELTATPDDRYLSQMSLRVFRAGLKHSLVDAKWPAFEEVFAGFDLRRVRAMPDEALQALLGDTRLIRHWGKLEAIAFLWIPAEKSHDSLGMEVKHARARRYGR